MGGDGDREAQKNLLECESRTEGMKGRGNNATEQCGGVGWGGCVDDASVNSKKRTKCQDKHCSAGENKESFVFRLKTRLARSYSDKAGHCDRQGGVNLLQ